METGRRSKGASKLTPKDVPSDAMIKAALLLEVTLVVEGKFMVGRVEIGGIITIWKTMHAVMMAEKGGPEATDELINRIANAIALTAGDPWFDYRPHAKAVLECLQEQSE